MNRSHENTRRTEVEATFDRSPSPKSKGVGRTWDISCIKRGIRYEWAAVHVWGGGMRYGTGPE